MTPKPRRKMSTASKDSSTKASGKSAVDASMPPPPDPVPVHPQGVLEPEINALEATLRNTVVRTGQLYEFYADTQKLDMHDRVPNPPYSLLSSLGNEVERYDQLVDAMESHLYRAIAVLQRDLSREQNRLEEIEAQANASKSVPDKPSSPSTNMEGITTQDAVLTGLFGPFTEEPKPMTAGDKSTPSGPLAPNTTARRPSAVSLSSLHRPGIPGKLDLSSTALRIGTDEASMRAQSGLVSPVTLAPKSARPTASSEYPPDFMAALGASNGAVDIDLTLSEAQHTHPDGHNMPGNLGMDPNLGNTADKPIELDLEGVDIDMNDMNDIFGDSTADSGAQGNMSVDLFGMQGESAPSDIVTDENRKADDSFDMELLGALSSAGENTDLFGPFRGDEAQSGSNGNVNSIEPVPTTGNTETLNVSGGPAPAPAPVEGTTDSNQTEENPSSSSGEHQFDLSTFDLSQFNPEFDMNLDEMNMADFLNIEDGSQAPHAEDGGSASQ